MKIQFILLLKANESKHIVKDCTNKGRGWALDTPRHMIIVAFVCFFTDPNSFQKMMSIS